MKTTGNRYLIPKLLMLRPKKPQQGKVDVCICISVHLEVPSMEIQCYSHSQYSSMCINSLKLPLHFRIERKLWCTLIIPLFKAILLRPLLRTSPILLHSCHLLYLNCLPIIKKTAMHEIGLSAKHYHYF